MSNGNLNRSSLVQAVNFHPIQIGAEGLLLPHVAHQWAVMAWFFEHDLSQPLIASECYRDYARQVYLYDQYQHHGGALAARPGTSNHGDGTTVDVASGVGFAGTAGYKWMNDNAQVFGFKSDVPSEHWHWHYVGGETFTQIPATPTITIDEDEMSQKDIDNINTKLDALSNKLDAIPGNVWGTPLSTPDGRSVTAGRRLAGIDRLKENVSTIGDAALARIVAAMKGDVIQ